LAAVHSLCDTDNAPVERAPPELAPAPGLISLLRNRSVQKIRTSFD